MDYNLNTFAWLIHEEVEAYVNAHIEEYKLWTRSATDKIAEKQDDKNTDAEQSKICRTFERGKVK